MASGDVVFRLTGQEASAVQAFLKVIDTQNKSRSNTREHNKELREQEKAFSDAASSAMSIATAIAAAAGVTGTLSNAISQFRQDMADSVAASKELQHEFVNLQFIGQHFQDPAARQRVLDLSKSSGIAAPEMARGLYALESMTGTSTPAQRADMTPALINLRRTTNVPLDQLVPTFAKMKAIYPGLTGVEQANISQYMLEKAAVSDPASMASAAPNIFAAGLVGGTDARTTAAVGSFLTLKTGTPDRAAQGLQTIFNKLMLQDPDESELMNRALSFGAVDPLAGRKGLLKRAGVLDSDDAYTRSMKLSDLNQREKLTPQDLKYLGGERGMRYLSILFSDPSGVRGMVEDFKRETGADKDIVGTKLQGALAIDPTLRAITAGQRLDAGTFATRQNPDLLAWENVNKIIEQKRLSGEMPSAFQLTPTALKVSAELERASDPSAANAQSFLRDVIRSNWGRSFRPRMPAHLRGEVTPAMGEFQQAENEAWNEAGRLLGTTVENLKETSADLKSSAQKLNTATVNRDAHTEGGR